MGAAAVSDPGRFAVSFVVTAAILLFIYFAVVMAARGEDAPGWRPIAETPPCGARVLLWYFGAPIMGWRYCDITEGGAPYFAWLEPAADRAIFETKGITHWRALTREESEGPNDAP